MKYHISQCKCMHKILSCNRPAVIIEQNAMLSYQKPPVCHTKYVFPSQNKQVSA
jgi:hypothetical protein